MSDMLFLGSVLIGALVVGYGAWCFTRPLLLQYLLNKNYAEFVLLLKSQYDDDDLVKSPAFQNTLANREDCFKNARSLNMFFVDSKFKEGFKGQVNGYVDRNEPDRHIRSALEFLIEQKVMTVEFYVKYCRLSGWFWQTSQLAKNVCMNLRISFGGKKATSEDWQDSKIANRFGIRATLRDLMETLIMGKGELVTSSRVHETF